MGRVVGIRGVAVWMLAVVGAAFALGFLGPIAFGLLVRPDPFLPGALGLLGALVARALLFRRERRVDVRIALAIFAYLACPVASCSGHFALNHSPLQPLSYGVRSFDAHVWRHPAGDPDRDRGRSPMTAHLLLGGLLERKHQAAVRALLGTPDCGERELEDAWYLGFASHGIDPDCLHVHYRADGAVDWARVLQH